MTTRSTTARDHQIGAAIKKCRTMRGMTRNELALKVGVTHQQLQKYEVGTNRVTVSRLEEIARALDVPTAELMETTDSSYGDFGRMAMAHMRNFQALPEVQRVAVHRFVSDMAAGAAA